MTKKAFNMTEDKSRPWQDMRATPCTCAITYASQEKGLGG